MHKTITFIVTKDCQLACKYCYLVGKNVHERMTYDIAKEAVDYIFSHPDEFPEDGVFWDFIGGEPFLEIDLIEKICDYITVEMYRRRHRWLDNHMFAFTTNGINYRSSKVQHYIRKYHDRISLTITIDGTEKKHDLNRIYKESGRGSYKDVVRNIPLWLEQFPGASTKVTVSSADIPYITESVSHLYGLGIREIHINCVFEDVWKEGDETLLENELIKLADLLIDSGMYKDLKCSFFDPTIGKPLDLERNNNNWCGAGRMLSVDAAGNFYPCTRFAQFSLRSKKPIIIGNVKTGINQNLLRPFLSLDRFTQSTNECLNCDIASGCAWCQGENYDAADSNTIYQRATAICKMHKARVRANNYFFNKLFAVTDKAEAEKFLAQSSNNGSYPYC